MGHCKSDSVESKCRKKILNVLIERTTRLVHICKLSSKKYIDTKNAIIKRLSVHPGQAVKPITYDNSPENAKHLSINETLNCDSYFCQPYHSWEKGSVEQVNGLIRRYIPKGSDLANVHYNTIEKIENLLNNRPRRCLGFKTPFEVYNEMCGALSPWSRDPALSLTKLTTPCEWIYSVQSSAPTREQIIKIRCGQKEAVNALEAQKSYPNFDWIINRWGQIEAILVT